MMQCARCGLPIVTEHCITDQADECIDALKTALGPFLDWGVAERTPRHLRNGDAALAEVKARRHAIALANLLRSVLRV